MVSATDKNPTYVEAGRRGARARWGEPRVLRLDDLTSDQRRLVLALVDAAKETAPNANGTASKESRRASDADHPRAA